MTPPASAEVGAVAASARNVVETLCHHRGGYLPPISARGLLKLEACVPIGSNATRLPLATAARPYHFSRCASAVRKVDHAKIASSVT